MIKEVFNTILHCKPKEAFYDRGPPEIVWGSSLDLKELHTNSKSPEN